MPQTCIITDNSVQFPQNRFKGQEYVKILPLIPKNFGYIARQGKHSSTKTPTTADVTVAEFAPPSSTLPQSHKLIPAILSLSRKFHNLLFILPAPNFSPSISIITALLEQVSISANVEIVNSQTISLGVGWLIQTCAGAIANGGSISQIKYYLNNKIPHVYTLIYFHNLLNLKALNLLDPDQALVGDLLGIHPLVLLEKGQILPYQKVRNARNIGDLIINYAHEFEKIQFLGIIFGSDVGVSDKKNLTFRTYSAFPKIKTEFQMLNKPLDNILGTQSIGFLLIDKE